MNVRCKEWMFWKGDGGLREIRYYVGAIDNKILEIFLRLL